MAKRRSSSAPPPESPTLTSSAGARLLRDLAERGKELASRTGSVGDDDQRAWQVAVEESLSAALGRNHEGIFNVLNPNYSPVIDMYAPEPSEAQKAAIRAATIALQFKMIEEHAAHLERLAAVEQPTRALTGATPMAKVERICERFHLVVRQLRHRHDNRQTLEVTDEYDVQDLLHALLLVEFEDVRPEEWTPTYAGGAGRMDFLLKTERLVIETKMTRPGLNAKKLGEELQIDIARYQQHQDCQTLVCFVYDPLGLVANPRGVERDLTRRDGEFQVAALIRPR